MKNFLLLFALFFLLVNCKTNEEKEVTNADTTVEEPFFKLSLAQWSLNREFRGGEMSPISFAEQAKKLGFDGIEYVNQLYFPILNGEDSIKMTMDELVAALKSESEKHGVENLLIMIDHEGDLAAVDEADRDEAVEKHKKWVDAAATLGCHSIRVNLFGAKDAETWKKTAVDGLTKLSTYAATKNINVIVENHGGLSSNAALLMEVINAVDMKNCGTLPDFGNFCVRRENGENWGSPCVEEYDIYKGVEELMPKAFAVSAKSFAFDEEGNETKIDYTKMMKIVKDAGYTGYVGIEFEGEAPALEGIEATKNLLLNAAKEL